MSSRRKRSGVTYRSARIYPKGVRIHGIPLGTPHGLIQLYLKNSHKSGGGNIRILKYNPNQRDPAFVIFEEDNLHWEVVRRRNHIINRVEVQAELVIPGGTNAAKLGDDSAVDPSCSQPVRIKTTLTDDEVVHLISSKCESLMSALQKCSCSLIISPSTDDARPWFCQVAGKKNDADIMSEQIEQLLHDVDIRDTDLFDANSSAPGSASTRDSIDRFCMTSENPDTGNAASLGMQPDGIDKSITADFPKDVDYCDTRVVSATAVDVISPVSTSDSAHVCNKDKHTPVNSTLPVESQISISKSVVPFVLGQSGETVAYLESENDVTVRIVPMPEDTSLASCLVRGQLSAKVDAATNVILSVNTKYKADKWLKSGEHERRPLLGDTSQWIKKLRCYMLVPTNTCGLVIGKGGESIRKIQQLSGASVRVLKNSSSSDVTICHIEGAKERIRMAAALVAEKARLTTYPECPARDSAVCLHEGEQLSIEDCKRALHNRWERSIFRGSHYSYCNNTWDALYVGNLSIHVSREALCCWIYLATGYFPSVLCFSLDGTKAIAVFNNASNFEARAIEFAADNPVDNKTLQLKVVQRTARAQLHGLPDGFNIVDILPNIGQQCNRNITAAECFLRNVPVLVLEHALDVQIEGQSIPLTGPNGTSLCITPHFDELGILKPEQIWSTCDLGWINFMRDCDASTFTTPCLVVSGCAADKIDRQILKAFLSNSKKSNGGSVRNLLVTENTAVVQFEDPMVTRNVHEKFKAEGISIGGLQLRADLVEPPASWPSSDKCTIRFKNVGAATVDSLKYVLQAVCQTAVRDIQLIWTKNRDVEAIVTFECEIDIAQTCARLSVVTLDGCRLEIETVAPCTSAIIQNVPLDAHSDLLELCLPMLPDDSVACRKVAAHTWLAQFKNPSSLENLLKSRITYLEVELCVTANYQDFVMIQNSGQQRGVRGTPRLKLDCLDSSVMSFIMSARRDKFFQVMTDHYGAIEPFEDSLPTLYFTPIIRDVSYWQLLKKWCRLTDAVLQIAHDVISHTISLVGPLAEFLAADNSVLPHFQAFRDVVSSQGSDLQLTVVKACAGQSQNTGQSLSCLQLLGVQSAVHMARTVLEKLLSSPCTSCLPTTSCRDNSPHCLTVCLTESVQSSMHLDLLRKLGFGENNNGDASLGPVGRCASAVDDGNVKVQLLFDQHAVSLQGCCVAVQRAFTDVHGVLSTAVSRKLLGSDEWARLMRQCDTVRDYVCKKLREAVANTFKDGSSTCRAATWSVSLHEPVVTVMATDAEVADVAEAALLEAVVDRLRSMSPSFFEAVETMAWHDFIVLVQNVYGDSVLLTVRRSSAQLQLTCTEKDHLAVQQDLREFLSTHTVTSDFVPYPAVFVAYVCAYSTHDLRQIEDQLVDKLVRIVPRHECVTGEQSIDVERGCKSGAATGFDIQGNEEGIEISRALLKLLRDELIVRCKRLDVPGAATFFASAANKAELLQDLNKSTGTFMLITEESDDATPTAVSATAAHSGSVAEISDGVPAGSVTSSLSSGGDSRVAGTSSMGKACLIKGTYIMVALGDITEESTTFIVNGTDRSLSLTGQVSAALLRKGGSTIKQDCAQRGPIDSSGILISTPGLLKCRSIMHVDAALDSGLLVKTCLEKAVEYSAESIAFPAIGSGGYGKSVNSVAKAMLEAAVNFLEEREPKNLKHVKFVIFDRSSLVVFESVLRKACSENRKSLKEIMFSLIDKFRASVKDVFLAPMYDNSFFTGSSGLGATHGVLAAVAQTVIAPVAAGLPETACKIADLNGKLDEELQDQSLADGITEAIRNAARELPKAKAVSCCLCGPSDAQIDEALLQLISRCSKIFKTKKIEEPKEVISSLTEKQFESISLLGTWLDVKIDVDNTDHVISMTSLDGESLSHMSDRLRDALHKQRRVSSQVRNTPINWSIVEGFAAPAVGPWTEEYKGIERDLRRSLGFTSNQYYIISIARIENAFLWQQYLAYKKKIKSTISSSLPSLPVERQLWHGTAEEAIDSICHHGFNRSYCGKNAVVYGQGVYFARDASYSASDTYSVPSSRNEKHVIYARVVTGEYELGNSQTRVPKRKPNHSTATFESTVDNLLNPSIFVTYNDTQAYPAYVIKFKLVTGTRAMF